MKEPGQIDIELLNVIYEREGMAAVEAAVRADERERCAQVVEAHVFDPYANTHNRGQIAAAIRNLGENGG